MSTMWKGKITDERLINRLKNYYNIEDDTYTVPLYELYNLYDNSLLWKIKYYLYKFLDFLNHEEQERPNSSMEASKS